MTITASVSIDVPDLAQDVAFYCAAFGFSKESEPVPSVAVLRGLNDVLNPVKRIVGD